MKEIDQIFSLPPNKPKTVNGFSTEYLYPRTIPKLLDSSTLKDEKLNAHIYEKVLISYF